MIRRNWPVALAVLFVAQLIWYLVYTERIVQALRVNAETLTEIYAQVQEGINDPSPAGADLALYRLQSLVLRSGVPLVITGVGDSVLGAQNLPFEVDLDTPEGQEEARRYVRRLDIRHPPIGDPASTQIHYGDTPEVSRLRWSRWFQVGGLFLTALIGLMVIRYQRRAEGEQAWTAMARELAHQLGTPLSSLQGWLELLELPREERPEAIGKEAIADGIREDLVRLGRISRRFELIGREPELARVDLRKVLEDLERYLLARIPRLTSSGVELSVDVQPDLPNVMGTEVLLVWALENVVKNALDALAGKGGQITISASRDDRGSVTVRIADTGAGVPYEVRDRIFEPGVTTKSSGWGVGLTLSRRIIEVVHGGRIELSDGREEGATFYVRLPAAKDA
ncbi:sensor histidine kinase [Gemmatimonadota bacterium]